ncbi:MAG: hypothetical protein ABSG32_12435 [Terriglobia bacterium]|jgi:hypothetical protein
MVVAVLPTSDKLLVYGLEYVGCGMEAFILLLLAAQGRWRRLKGLCLYVAGLFLLDGLGRMAALNYFGSMSRQYAYFYWLTDVALALGAFLLTCGFFRRACNQEERLWRFVRLLLVFVFVLAVAISALDLTRHYTQLYTGFIVEFSQNLYFSCLVLNTMLYVMIQQLAIDDEELGLLVCGMGLQFAGEAAGLALLHLTSGEHMARLVFSFLNPACTLGMFLTWVYAIVKTPEALSVRSKVGKQASLVAAVAD